MRFNLQLSAQRRFAPLFRFCACCGNQRELIADRGVKCGGHVERIAGKPFGDFQRKRRAEQHIFICLYGIPSFLKAYAPGVKSANP